MLRSHGHDEVLQLSRWPVVAVQSVADAGGETLASEYEVDATKGLLHCFNSMWWGRIEVVYQAGYILPGQFSPTLPGDVEQAVLALVRAEWFGRDRDPSIRSETTEGVGSSTFTVGNLGDRGLSADVAGLLDLHRMPVVG